VTTLLLVRHANCDHVGKRLVGRLPNIRLNSQGEREAETLASRLASMRLAAIYSSPLERAVETARTVAGPHELVVRSAEGLVEIDYGDWTGLTLDEVRALPEWRAYHASRSRMAIPNGERIAEVQARAVATIEQIGAEHPNDTVVAVSHGDVIRAIIAHVACIPLDAIDRFEVLPASVAVIELGKGWRRLRALNAGSLPG
jgi:probable phosphoglycerate mutase